MNAVDAHIDDAYEEDGNNYTDERIKGYFLCSRPILQRADCFPMQLMAHAFQGACLQQIGMASRAHPSLRGAC